MELCTDHHIASSAMTTLAGAWARKATLLRLTSNVHSTNYTLTIYTFLPFYLVFSFIYNYRLPRVCRAALSHLTYFCYLLFI